MYASIVAEASSWSQLVEIDRQLQQATIARRCPWCQGALHVADHPRKPRGLPLGLEELWSRRFNTCCGSCRRRSMPPSVWFLGRRVYVGAIVVLATMFALVCRAARRTLERWSAWWTQALPATTWWRQMRGRFDRPVDGPRLPASLLQRYEAPSGAPSPNGPANFSADGPHTNAEDGSTPLRLAGIHLWQFMGPPQPIQRRNSSSSSSTPARSDS